MEQQKILITGATGATGGNAITKLLIGRFLSVLKAGKINS